jgi:transposase
MMAESEEITVTGRPRRNHSPAVKAQVALAAIEGEKTLAELAQLAQRFGVPPNQITQWRSQLLEGASGVFGADGKAEPAPAVETLHAKIGERTLANGFLAGALGKAGLLPITRR